MPDHTKRCALCIACMTARMDELTCDADCMNSYRALEPHSTICTDPSVQGLPPRPFKFVTSALHPRPFLTKQSFWHVGRLVEQFAAIVCMQLPAAGKPGSDGCLGAQGGGLRE